MEKVIMIGGNEIKQKSNAANAILYRAEFGEDIAKAWAIYQAKGKDGAIQIENLDTIRMMRLVWVMLRAADPNAPAFDKWLESIETFPILDVFNETIDLVAENLVSTTTIKNADAAAKKISAHRP